MPDNLKIPTDWTFKNANVAKHFDDHVREQLPFYDMATQAVEHIGRHYIPHGGLVYDIGRSTRRGWSRLPIAGFNSASSPAGSSSAENDTMDTK